MENKENITQKELNEYIIKEITCLYTLIQNIYEKALYVSEADFNKKINKIFKKIDEQYSGEIKNLINLIDNEKGI